MKIRSRLVSGLFLSKQQGKLTSLTRETYERVSGSSSKRFRFSLSVKVRELTRILVQSRR